MNNLFKTFIFLFFTFNFSAQAAETIEGRVVGVHDGDTITLLMKDNQQLKIRLAQIDAPETDQAFGQKSKQSLSDMVFNKTIKVEKETIDKYGRTVGTIFVEGMDANKEQVKRDWQRLVYGLIQALSHHGTIGTVKKMEAIEIIRLIRKNLKIKKSIIPVVVSDIAKK